MAREPQKINSYVPVKASYTGTYTTMYQQLSFNQLSSTQQQGILSKTEKAFEKTIQVIDKTQENVKAYLDGLNSGSSGDGMEINDENASLNTNTNINNNFK